ncbi:MAG TPA: NUDIX domain-containing protein [Candidatus Paceibacterota bacterium]
MNERVRGIIIKDGRIALIKRVKPDRTYYIFPGGGVEDGENHSQALIREMKEELGINVSIGEFVGEYHENNSKGIAIVHYFYLCEQTGGTFGTGDGLEYQPNTPYGSGGTHDPIWIPLSKLPTIDLQAENIKKFVIEKYS